ncbi:MAG: hypothetical protein HY820_36430 [Acidobacteria bacterium]|nr:hypothetical protein [Acidobacteriota bacterium]
MAFAAGFAMGALRVGQIAPRTGDLIAVLIEMPFMLLVSWFACSWMIRRMRVGPALTERITMGAAAFLFLMIAELVMSMTLFGSSPTEYFAEFREPHGLIGLAGQLAFALFPLAQRHVNVKS